MDKHAETLAAAKQVLADNDQGSYTVPMQGMYPHQWLWDSAFIAIGLRHLDIDRAQAEVLHLLTGQWHNGMIPNMVLSRDPKYARDANIWNSKTSKFSPDNIPTSGITQPPMLAEAIVKIGERLKAPERRSWYKKVYPALVRHHLWLYEERDPHNEGLVLQIHPWETGLDNTPPWMVHMHEHTMPMWIRVVEKLKLGGLINLLRRDTKFVPAEQRLNIIEALMLYSTQRRLRRKRYDIDKILNRSLFAIEDLAFNCILIRANQHLRDIAKTMRKELPSHLVESMERTEKVLDQLWDPYTGQYYSRNFVTHNLLKESTLATLLPLYAGTVTKDRAKQLVKLLENQHAFGTHYPVPSVPKNSEWFKPLGYWQGPAWINTNWLIIDGLKRSGFNDHAEALRETTIDLVAQGGNHEYFSPLDGTPGGAKNFSWTAALTIDLIKSA